MCISTVLLRSPQCCWDLHSAAEISTVLLRSPQRCWDLHSAAEISTELLRCIFTLMQLLFGIVHCMPSLFLCKSVYIVCAGETPPPTPEPRPHTILCVFALVHVHASAIQTHCDVELLLILYASCLLLILGYVSSSFLNCMFHGVSCWFSCFVFVLIFVFYFLVDLRPLFAFTHGKFSLHIANTLVVCVFLVLFVPFCDP
jgi:hypothetical protein